MIARSVLLLNSISFGFLMNDIFANVLSRFIDTLERTDPVKPTVDTNRKTSVKRLIKHKAMYELHNKKNANE
jgi:hypothetical protein